MSKKRRRDRISFNKKLFDKECRLKRHELRKLGNRKKHREPLNITLGVPSFLFVTKLAGNSHLTNETGTMHDIIAKRLNLINGQIDSSTGKIKEN